jgi:tetratricopeptide (TPR) repeat protein
MAEIALRNYNQEVQDLIDHGHLDEAIAHCQHILARYPKHVETYRLLGKAYLEQGRHADAADIFQRVLSAIPDDFLSHVAMAIMREDSGNLDAAIWHMERAHEVNPSNPTVQTEVRRLRGRRDGVEPARLRLTRAALARMYIKGGFFAQAVAEIRAALEEDADRPDLQVMLASALAQSGQPAEAGEICNAVLGKLPFCLEANQIQAQILWRVGRKPEAQEVFRRLSLLDPYRGVRPPTDDGRIPEVAAGAVTLSRLTWEPGMPGSSAPPGWKEGLSISSAESGGEETKIPAWLEGAAPGGHQSPFVGDADTGGLQPPDWLSEGAVGLPVSPDGAEALLGADEPELSLTAAAEDIPDWLRQVPAEKKPEAAPGGFADWLKPEGAVEAGAKDLGDAPDWLKAAEQDAGLSVPGEGLPGWVGGDASELEPLPPAQPGENLPGWLQADAPEMAGSPPTQEFPELSGPPGAAPKISMGGKKDLDWLRGEAQKGPGQAPFEAGGEVVDDGSAGEVPLPDWMKPVGASERKEEGGAGPLVPFSDGEKRPAEPEAAAPSPERPSWLEPEKGEGLWRDEKGGSPEPKKDEEEKAAGTAPLAARVPGLLTPPGEEAEAEPAEVPEGDGSEWLKRLPSEPSKPSDMETPAWLKAEALESEEPGEAEKPEWLRPAEEEAPAQVGEIPDWLKAAGRVLPTALPETAADGERKAEPAVPAPVPADMPDWLKPVGAEDLVLPPVPKIVPPPLTEAEKPRVGEAPGWLLELASQTAAEPIAEPEPASELPAWLDERQPGASDTISRWLGQNTPAEESEEPSAEEPAAGELPSWISTMAEERGPAGRDAAEPSQEPREAGLAASQEPALGEMPTPDWIKAAMGEVDSEVSSAFPGTVEPSAPEGTAPPSIVQPVAPVPAPEAEAPKPPVLAPSMPRMAAEMPVAPPPVRPRKPSPPVAVQPPAEVTPPKPAPAPLAVPDLSEEPLPAAMPEPGTWVPAEPVKARAVAPERAPTPVAKAAAPTPPASPAPGAKPKRPAKRKPARLTAAEAEAQLRVAREQMRTSRVDEAVHTYKRVLETDELAAQVASDLEQAVETKPLLAELWQLLGDACHRTGKLDRAYEAYEKALTLL